MPLPIPPKIKSPKRRAAIKSLERLIGKKQKALNLLQGKLFNLVYRASVIVVIITVLSCAGCRQDCCRDKHFDELEKQHTRYGGGETKHPD